MAYAESIVSYANQGGGWKWYWLVGGCWKRSSRGWRAYEDARRAVGRYVARHKRRRNPRPAKG